MVLRTPRLVLLAAIIQSWLIVVLGDAAKEREEYVTSQCLVEEWEPWSSCIGNCNGAWQVRNRRVRQPSVPDQNGNPPPPCPHLYEVNRCSFPECEAPHMFRLPEDSILVTQGPPEIHRATTTPPSQSPPEPSEEYDEMSFEAPEDFLKSEGPEPSAAPEPAAPSFLIVANHAPRNVTPASMEFVTPRPPEPRKGQVLPPSSRVIDDLSPVRPPAFPENREKKPDQILQRIAHVPPRFEKNSAERSNFGNFGNQSAQNSVQNSVQNSAQNSAQNSLPNDEDFEKPSIIRNRFGNETSTTFRPRINVTETVTAIIFNVTEAPVLPNVFNSAEGSGGDEYEYDLTDGAGASLIEASSVCDTSTWAEWSLCTGNCKMSWQVRNRDVVKPSIPIRGQLLVPCPHLYEVRLCHLRGCKMQKIPTPNSDLSVIKESGDSVFEQEPIPIDPIAIGAISSSPPRSSQPHGSPPAEPTFDFRTTPELRPPITTARTEATEATTNRPAFQTVQPFFDTTFDSQIFETSIHLPSWWDSGAKTSQNWVQNSTAKWETAQNLESRPTPQLQNTTPNRGLIHVEENSANFREIPGTSEFLTKNSATPNSTTISEQFLTRNTRTTTTDEKTSTKTTRKIRGQTIIFGVDHGGNQANQADGSNGANGANQGPEEFATTRAFDAPLPRNRSFQEAFSTDHANFTRFGIARSIPLDGPGDRRKGNLAAIVAKIEASDNTTEFVPAFPLFTSTVQTASPVPIFTTTIPFFNININNNNNNNNNNNTNFTNLPVWNSRQFRPPDISSEEELVRVKRILEAHGLNLSDLNWMGDKLHCLKVPMVSECPDGKQPQPVLRWFRLPGHEECAMYNYPYCGHALEFRDGPLKFEEDCYLQCYTSEEKQEMEIFKRMHFEKGFRTDEGKN